MEIKTLKQYIKHNLRQYPHAKRRLQFADTVLDDLIPKCIPSYSTQPKGQKQDSETEIFALKRVERDKDKELVAIVEKWLSKEPPQILTDKQIELIELHLWQGYSLAEIAEQGMINTVTSRRHLHRMYDDIFRRIIRSYGWEIVDIS